MSGPLRSVFDIPELFDMVLSLLSTQDLARCVLVNKKWRDAAIRYLWHTVSGRYVSWRSWRQTRALQRIVLDDYLRMQEREEQSMIDIIQHERPGEVPVKSEVDAEQRIPSRSSFSKYGCCIKTLDQPDTIFKDLGRMTTGPSEEELLSHFLEQSVNVRALTLDLELNRTDRIYHIYKIVVDSLAPNLRELFLKGPLSPSYSGMSSRWYLYILSRCSSRLERLSIYNDPLQERAGDIIPDKLPIAAANLCGLKELVLDHCWRKDELSSWDWFWRSCSNVERLELRRWHRELTHDLATRIKDHLPKLTSIIINDGMVLKAVAPLLSACLGRLTNIQIGVTISRYCCQALTKHCGTLEVLQVTNILRVSSKALRRILTSSPKLKILITIDDKRHVRQRIPYIKAKDFIDVHPQLGMLNPWASETSLKVLKVKFSRIPRPDVTKRLSGRPRTDGISEGCVGEGERLQQRVYARLARFTNLEELCLGHDTLLNKYPGSNLITGEDYQYECLEMTLESGLGQLRRLKNLRVLDVRRMAQRIGLKEVQWMTQHWPMLQVIRGLHDDGDNLEAAEWLWKHSPIITVEVSSRAFVARQL